MLQIMKKLFRLNVGVFIFFALLRLSESSVANVLIIYKIEQDKILLPDWSHALQ
jgi:hypothetical protein